MTGNVMTDDEVIDLLTLAAGYDRRTVGDADVEAWSAIALLNGWTFAVARRALVEHFNSSNKPIMPADINTIISAQRKAISARFTENVSPPKELRDNPAAEIAWRRQFAEDYKRRALEAWAEDREPPALAQRSELGELERPQLSAAISDLVGRFQIPSQPRPVVYARARRLKDPAALEQARRELAARRSAALPAPEVTE
jgi:hypothetical protein